MTQQISRGIKKKQKETFRGRKGETQKRDSANENERIKSKESKLERMCIA